MKPKVTMYTIAKEVGMSIAAVSRAFDPKSCLKPEKRDLILETAKRLGYVPNRMASRLSSEPLRIGVLIYGQVRVYYSILERGIQSEKNAPQAHDGQVKTINHHAAADSRKQLGEKALCRNLCATVAASAL